MRESGFPEERVLIDHNNEETLPLVLDTGAGRATRSIPNTKMDEPRMVALVKKYGTERIIINSAADWGVSDPLKVPKTVAAHARARASPSDAIETIVWDNPVAFFAQSGRLDVAEIDAPARHRPARAVRGQLGAARAGAAASERQRRRLAMRPHRSSSTSSG